MCKKFFLITALLCLIMTFPAYAGDINANEQAVVSVIHGQFEQNGVVYQVKQEYINSAVGYLQKDDVNLSPEDAQVIISEIYSNVRTGVESGYLTEVGRKTPDEKQEAVQNGQDQVSETKEQGDAAVDAKEPSPVETVPAEVGGAEPVEAEPVETEPVVPEPIPMAISALEETDTTPQLNYEYISKDTQALMEQVHLPYDAVIKSLILLLVITVLIGGICFWEKKMAKCRHGKLRKWIKIVLAAEVAGIFLVLEVTGGLWLGAFQDGAILNRVDETGYYRAVYEELRHDTNVSFALMGIPEEVMDQAITYERVVMAGRQQIENNLNQGDYRAKTELLTDQLKMDIQEYLNQQSVVMTEKAQIGLDLLIQRIDAKYEKLLQWPFGSWWAQFSQDFRMFAIRVLPLLLLLAVGAHGLLLWMHHYRHRAVKRCGTGICIGSVAAILTGVIPNLTGMTAQREMTPEYMGQFFRIYTLGITQAIIAAGVIGILLGIVYWLIAKAWKEGKQ